MNRLFFRTLLPVVLLALVALLYGSGLNGRFFFDDRANILVENGLHLEVLSIDSLFRVMNTGTGGPTGRPVARLSFALNEYLCGLEPFCFKLTNLLIHLATGALIFLLSLRIISSFRRAENTRDVWCDAVIVTFLWLCHPIQLLPVLHVVQRMTSLSAFFLILALLFHVQARSSSTWRSGLYFLIAWGGAWPLSVLSKETGLLFPGFVLAWELLVRGPQLRLLDRFAKGLSFGCAIGAIVAVVYLLTPAAAWLWSGFSIREFSLGERLLTEARVVVYYLGLIVFPRLEAFALFHDDFVISTGLFSPWTTAAAIATLLALIVTAWKVRKTEPLVTFGVTWYLLGHLLESTLLPLELVHEHRNYLPVWGILLAMVSLFAKAYSAAGVFRTLGNTLLIGAAVWFSGITAIRAHEFGEEVRRTQIEAQHHPDSARAQHDAARVLAGMVASGEQGAPAYSLARSHYELAGRISTSFKMSWLGLIDLNCRVGVPVEQDWLRILAERLKDTPFAPGDRNVLYALKEMAIENPGCLQQEEVGSLFMAAIRNPVVSDETRATLYSWYADYLWLVTHDLQSANEALGRSLSLLPGNASNRLKLAQLQFLGQDYSGALASLRGVDSTTLNGEEIQTMNELLASPMMRVLSPADRK